MIVAMKKIFLLMPKNQGQAALNVLEGLGLVHIENELVPSSSELSLINEQLIILEQARTILANLNSLPAKKNEHNKFSDPLIFARHIIDLQKRYDQLKEYSVSLNNAQDTWKDWGDFDPQQIKELAEKNIFLKLYQIPKEQIKNLPPSIVLKKISCQGNLINCLVASITNLDLGFKELELPKMSLAQIKFRLEEDRKIMQTIRQELLIDLNFQAELVAKEKILIKQKEFYSYLSGMGQAGDLIYLRGYIPFDTQELLINKAKANGWGILTLDPDASDAVPTLVRNPAWIKLIQPVLKLLELVPGYEELDISMLFLIFFSLFFGIIIGDAGYGLLYLILTLVVHKRMGSRFKDKTPIFLFYLLSSCAMIWGVLTGTFFGQAWLADLGIKPLVPILNNISFIQGFCFLIGALHLSIAHLWRFFLKLPSLKALVDLGWLGVIWAAFFLAKNLLLGDSFPFFGSWLIYSGIALVVLFTNPQKNILKGISDGLMAIALGLVNNFTDVVSYVRLFAVGLAGVAIADAFNVMAASSGTGSIAAIIGTVLILVAGHTLNFVLGPMSVLVHGVRLNVLEFCSHASVAWSGFSYKPFSKK